MPSGQKKEVIQSSDEGRKQKTPEDEHLIKSKVLNPVKSHGKALDADKIDFHEEENKRDHCTDQYEREDLIVRRGLRFKLTLGFDRDINEDDDIIILQFTCGDCPRESKGSLVRIPLMFDGVGASRKLFTKWNAEVTDCTGSEVTCEVTPPHDCIVGLYSLFIETTMGSDKHEVLRIKDFGEGIIILFNPWCEEDVVYMANEEKRKEYVLNENGIIWVGSKCHPVPKPWNFGQFDAPCLEAALHILDVAELQESSLCCVFSIIRCISSMSNSKDGCAVMEGSWSHVYPQDSTKPEDWNGSVSILDKFNDTGKPVQFGQCWVFAGVVTTLLRALGIPTRCVTNYESSHDTDLSFALDYHFNEDHEPLKDDNDLIWNFHVWNESWLKRIDLPQGYDGWQAHDATAHECSDGIMRCGPASVHAIKEGHSYLNYDTAQMFSEVHGDMVLWTVKENGVRDVAGVHPGAVGHKIVTKAVAKDEMEDITHIYKYPKGSEDVRRIAKMVHGYTGQRRCFIYDYEVCEDLKFSYDLPVKTLIGEDFEIGIKIHNTTEKEQKVKVTAAVVNSFYTGTTGDIVEKMTAEKNMEAGKELHLKMKVPNKNYMTHMNVRGLFQLFVTVVKKETGCVTTEVKKFCLAKPPLTIEAPHSVKISNEATATIKFKNTTKLTHTNLAIHYEGCGLSKGSTIKVNKTLKPGEQLEEKIKFCPYRKAGCHTELLVSLSTDQFSGIFASKMIHVEKEC